MKYFTKELWRGLNSTDEATERDAFEQWKRNRPEYWRQLEELQPRLSKKAYRFFTRERLHDGRLLVFRAGDAINHDVHGPKKFDINVHQVAVEMKVLGENLDVLYTLGYKKVRKVLFDYPTAQPLFHREGHHIDDWGYDELTAVDENWLRHEVLFASGTTILIEFKTFVWEREKCEGRRYIS